MPLNRINSGLLVGSIPRAPRVRKQVVFDAPGFDENIERGECILLGLGHPDLLEGALGLRLLALRQLVQDVRGLVHPTALAACLGPHFLDRLPEAERAVGDCELGRCGKSAPLQVARAMDALAPFLDARGALTTEG